MGWKQKLDCTCTLFLMLVLYGFFVSGGFQSAVCHEEPLAGSTDRPHREEKFRTERKPADSWPRSPGTLIKH